MGIVICNACENNLKRFTVDIPLGRITALTGVSGSGKSSLLKNVLAATGARKYTCTQSKTVRSALMISNFIKVDEVTNLPQTVFIDAKNSISTPRSTVSTVSGAHELLRNLFLEIGECFCPFCGKRINDEGDYPTSFMADLICDERYESFTDRVSASGLIKKEFFFDKNQKSLPRRGRTARFAEIHFELKNCSEKMIAELDRDFGCIVLVDDGHERYNPLKEVLCKECGRAVPRLTRGRMSFTTSFEEGGGMCRKCNGSGQIAGTDIESFIINDQKTFLGGAICFVDGKGIKYTQINESIIKAFARREGIDLKKKVKDFSSEELRKMMEGDAEPLSIGVGGGKKKNVLYRGVIGELKDSFLKGKGGSRLSKMFEKKCCSSCHGTRMDEETRGLRLQGKPLDSFLRMTFSELRDWCEAVQHEISHEARPYLERLLRRLERFCRVSCGHLSLDRASNTLSGGELQRIRVCALLNASVNGICYLLDEPSSGLHEQDIESLGALLRDICDKGNTIVFVEHNRKLLSFCDWIVEIGPEGGEKGGTLVFSDTIDNVSKYKSPTARLLSGKLKDVQEPFSANCNRFFTLEHLRDNNLKDLTVSIPYGAFTTVCGISGSGKSTLLRQVLWDRVGKDACQYGFAGSIYLGQGSSSIPYTSTVATQTDCFHVIVKLFSKHNNIPPDYFMPNSSKGKCPICTGRGILLSAENESIGTCHQCRGQKFHPDVLMTTLNSHQFSELMIVPLSELGKYVADETVIRFSEMASLLGIGYLTLSRSTATLSKGEFQRLKIANSIAQKVSDYLFLLDEPSKGLHATDAVNFVIAIRKLTSGGNTVVAVEHSPTVIRQSDYIVELGGTGKDGGRLLYSGIAAGIVEADTPTGRAIKTEKPVRGHQVVAGKNNCEYEIGGKTFSYSMNKIHDVTALRSQFKDIVAMTVSDLLSASIPGSSFYSRAKYYNECIISSPVFRSIDFRVKNRYDYSLYDVLGLRDAYMKDVIRQNEGEADLLRFVFDDGSLTGKCFFCKGRGKTETVEENQFLDGCHLTKEAQQFLKKSISFKSVSQELKKSLGVTLSDDYEENSIARQLLFYGYEAVSRRIKSEDVYEWPGLINFFLRNHAYYPDDLGEKIFASRHEVECPVCRGMMFRNEFREYASREPMSYQDLMRKPMEWVMEHLVGEREQRYSRLKRQLKYAIDLGLGGHRAGERMTELTETEAGLVCLSAMMGHGIFGTALAVCHMESLLPALQKKVMEALRQIGKTNTVFIG